MSLKGALKLAVTPFEAIVGGRVGKLATSAALIGAGIFSGNPQLVAAGLARGASALKKAPKISPAALERLDATLDPNAYRKIVFGRTAMNTDVRYMAYSGASQEYLEQIVCVASHEVAAIEEIWFNNDPAPAWTSIGGVQAPYAGYLTITPRLVGTSANGIAIDSVWTANATLTGCAYFHAQYKLTGNSKKAESPFASGVPSRMTVRGKGARLPDPRLSTAAGGSGAQSMSDQTTWAYTTAADSGRNGICQVLFYLLGWRINGKLAVGKGWAPARIDFASFIAAANIADESVAKAGGGTRPRYRSDGVCSEGDDPNTVLGGLLEACNAELVDGGGKIGIRIDYDDLATPVVALTEDDIIDGDDWPLSDSGRDVNVVKGQYTDPGDVALYQPRDYPQVVLAGADYGSPDGIQRIEPFPLPWVQDPAQAQFLAALKLQRRQYPGRYSARFKKKAWAASYGRVVTLSHAATGFAAKKFRVARQAPDRDGSIELVLREVASAMYAAPTETSVVAAAAPTPFNPLNHPLIQGIAESRNIIYRQVSDPAGANAIRDGDMWVELTSPMRIWARVGGTWQTAANYITSGSDIGVANGATKNTIYRQSTAPASPIDGDLWNDTSTTPIVIKVRVSGAWLVAGNLVTQGTDIGVANNSGSNFSPFTLLGAAGALKQTGNSIETTLYDMWNVYYARDQFPKHGQLHAQVSGLAPGYGAIIGLQPGAYPTTNGDPNGYNNGAFAFQFGGTLLDRIWIGSGSVVLSRAVSATAVYSIVLDNNTARFYEDQTELGTPGGYPVLARDALWHIAGQMLGPGPRFYNIQVAPYTDNYADSMAESPTRKWAGETGADVASDVVGQVDVVVAADYNGIPKTGELTKTLAYKLFRAGVQVTSGISWSRTLLSGNATTAISGSGTATFDISGPNNATLGDEAVVRIIATPTGGPARYLDVTIRKVRDQTPTGGTGGAGNPGTTASTSTILSISSTSHAVIAGPIRVKAGSAGFIRCTFPASFKRTSSSTGQTGELGKVQWSAVGGVMADVAAETASASDAETVNNAGDPTIQRAGSINVDVTKIGLTSGTDYDVQLLGRRSDVSGTASNIYTTAGTFTAAGS